MKHIAFIFSFLALTSILETVQAQGTFQNLNFEASIVPTTPPDGGIVSASLAFPGWIAYKGTNITGQAFLNSATSLGGAALSILGPGYTSKLQGNYTAALQGGLIGPPLELVPASLAQVGTVPTGYRSIMFHSAYDRPEVVFNGQFIPLALMGSGVSGSGVPYEILGGDISSLVGQSGELRFNSLPFPTRPSLTLLDNIFFSNQSIPEPSAFSLLTLAAFILCKRLRSQFFKPCRSITIRTYWA